MMVQNLYRFEQAITTYAPAKRRGEGGGMSTELATKMTAHSINQYWGGDDRGVMVQVTTAKALVVSPTVVKQLQQEGFVKLTMEEAVSLCSDLGQFIKREAVRRQGLLREDIERTKIVERTVFHEVCELPADMMAGPELAVEMVSRFCPKHK